MTSPGYPQECYSAYCGKILCDGCSSRPHLMAYHKGQGTLAKYERGQDELRAREVRYATERPKHCTHPEQRWCDCDWCRFLRAPVSPEREN